MDKQRILKQIAEAMDYLPESDYGEIPVAIYDNESETVALTYGAGHRMAVYSITVTRIY